MTDGREALEQAAQSGDENLIDMLLALGVDGPSVLLSLLYGHYHEAAARLVARGVDVHTTLMLAIGAYRYELRGCLTTLGAHLHIALQRAFERQQLATAQRILSYADRSTRQQALNDLINDETIDHDTKAQRLQFFIAAGVDTDEIMQNLIDGQKIAALRMLITLGAPTERLLMSLARQGNRLDAQTLMRAGADFAAPIRTLANSGEQQAVNILTLALTVVRDRMLEARQEHDAADVTLQQV